MADEAATTDPAHSPAPEARSPELAGRSPELGGRSPELGGRSPELAVFLVSLLIGLTLTDRIMGSNVRALPRFSRQGEPDPSGAYVLVDPAFWRDVAVPAVLQGAVATCATIGVHVALSATVQAASLGLAAVRASSDPASLAVAAVPASGAVLETILASSELMLYASGLAAVVAAAALASVSTLAYLKRGDGWTYVVDAGGRRDAKGRRYVEARFVSRLSTACTYSIAAIALSLMFWGTDARAAIQAAVVGAASAVVAAVRAAFAAMARLVGSGR